MKLMYPDALTEQESIGAPLDTHHLDKEMKDGVNLMVNATTAAIRRFTTVHTPLTPTGQYLYEAPECHHPTDVRETPSKHPPTAQQFKYQQTE